MPTLARAFTPPSSFRLVRWVTPAGIRDSFALPPAAPAPPDPSETMNDTPHLAPEHAARYRMAEVDLDRARNLDLLTTTLPRLALEYERLRAALADTLQLVRDIATPDHPHDPS
jgi:hypothetical protein